MASGVTVGLVATDSLLLAVLSESRAALRRDALVVRTATPSEPLLASPGDGGTGGFGVELLAREMKRRGEPVWKEKKICCENH